MSSWLLPLALFALPASAPGWRGLAWRGAVATALSLAAFLAATGGRFSVNVPAGDTNIGAGIVLYFVVTGFVAGFAARALSLGARRLGHHRPWSLWIEVAFFFGTPAVLIG